MRPSLRGAPSDLPYQPDAATLKAGLNFTFVTDLGDMDILGEVGGVGFYKEAKASSNEIEVLGMTLYVLGIPALIKSKKFAGWKKDEPMILQFEAIQELLKQRKKDSG